MNRKVKSFKQTVFLSEQNAVSTVARSVRSAVFRLWHRRPHNHFATRLLPWHRPTIILLLVYCPVDNTLFEVSPEIHRSDVSCHYCCYGNHAAGSNF